MRAIVPINDMQRRLPECGRIRTGVKKQGAKGDYPSAIDVFRFTSPDRMALEQVAETYGGAIKPWSDPKSSPNQFEVITEANEIRIVLPPNPLGGSPIYEMWGGGGCDRRCDGVTCTTIGRGPEGPEPVDVPCICDREQKMRCDPHTRLSVLLPEVRFTGVWRLDSKSWNVAQEMPGFVDLIASLQERGLTRGVLRLEHRTSVSGGQTRRFVVPVLGVDETVDALAAGAARFGGSALGAGSSAPALGRAPSEEALPPAAEEQRGTADDAPVHASSDIIDAEVVDDPPAPVGPVCSACGGSLLGCRVELVDGNKVHKDGCPPAAAEVRGVTDLDICRMAETVFGPLKESAPRGRKSKVVDECRHALAWAVTEGRTTSLKEMDAPEKHKLFMELHWLESGANRWAVAEGDDGDELRISNDSGRAIRIPFADALAGATA